jgi:hypothetical protein
LRCPLARISQSGYGFCVENTRGVICSAHFLRLTDSTWLENALEAFSMGKLLLGIIVVGVAVITTACLYVVFTF